LINEFDKGRVMAYKVIIVEDEPQVTELLRLILRHAEIEVFTALDGTKGLELIRQIKPDLVVLDIMMPNMSGWDVYDTIRSDETLCHIPIIIESVLPARSERKQTFAESPIDYYFTKPFDTTRLRREVGRMLGGKQLWPLPKPRPPHPQPLSVTGEFLTMAESEKAPARASEAPPSSGQTAEQTAAQTAEQITPPPVPAAPPSSEQAAPPARVAARNQPGQDQTYAAPPPKNPEETHGSTASL
jgi:DNA-binding response OmpR family regulator